MANREPRLFAVIPAAGTGNRFAANTPKQHATLLSKTVLEHSVSALLTLTELERLVVVIQANDVETASLPSLQDSRVFFAQGGDTRADSVLSGLTALKKNADDNDWVLVHDAARPCLLPSDVTRLLHAVRAEVAGGILAVPVVDTLKAVCAEKITHTVDRSALWQAQTPQMFRLGLLLEALQHARNEQRVVTDEASAMEAMGYAVKVIEGSRSNIKITYPEDLALAAFYLQQE